MKFNSHTGTHIDCPLHFFEEKGSADSMELGSFFGRAIKIDCSGIKDYITESILEKQKSSLSDADFVLFYTGYDKWWGKPQYFSGFPVLSKAAVEYLMSYSIKGIGFDTISADRIESEDFPVHKRALKNNVIIIENLKGLEKLPGKDFFISCFPLKIKNGDGSPVRAVAYIPEKKLFHNH